MKLHLPPAVCFGFLLWEFAATICPGFLPWEFAVAFCCRNSPLLFAVRICRGCLPWLCFVCVSIIITFIISNLFSVWANPFFVNKSFLIIESKIFLFMRISLLTVFLFVIAVAVMGYRRDLFQFDDNNCFVKCFIIASFDSLQKW